MTARSRKGGKQRLGKRSFFRPRLEPPVEHVLPDGALLAAIVVGRPLRFPG